MARNALEQYGLEDVLFSLIRARRKEGKLVFRVSSSETGEYLLKMYPPPRTRRKELSRSEAALRSQLLWQSALRREAGIPAPEPVPTSDGSLTCRSSVSVEGVSESKFCVLMRWIPGEQKIPEDLTPEVMRLVGSHTARLHQHAEGFSAPEGFVRPRWDWEYTFGGSRPLWRRGAKFYSENEMAFFRDAARIVRWDLRELGESSEVFGLIHRDIQAKNLVFAAEHVHAIDFESCGWGYYLFDLAVISFRLEDQGDRHAALHAALLEGYREVRDLPESHEAYLETFVVMRMVERLSVLLQMPDPASHAQGRTYLPDAQKRIREFVKSHRRATPGRFCPPRIRGVLGKLRRKLSF